MRRFKEMACTRMTHTYYAVWFVALVCLYVCGFSQLPVHSTADLEPLNRISCPVTLFTSLKQKTVWIIENRGVQVPYCEGVWGRRQCPLILNLGVRRRWGMIFMLWPSYPLPVPQENRCFPGVVVRRINLFPLRGIEPRFDTSEGEISGSHIG
jgi:hypothetical protein